MTHSMVAKYSFKRVLLVAVFGTAFYLGSLTSAHAALTLESEAYLKDASIVQGANNSGDLMLSKEINRAELMKIVVKTVASIEPSAEEYNNCFPDVHQEWFASYICWAKEEGYIQGYDDGMFHPERSVTEAEALKIINNALSLGVDSSIPSSRPWYEGYYNTAIKRNLVGNDTASRLAHPALRGDVFEQLTRALTVSELQKDTFVKGDISRLPARQDTLAPTALSQEKQDILSVITNTVDYGYQPQTGSGSGTVKIAIAASDARANIVLSMGNVSMVTGTKDTLDRAQVTLSLHTDIQVDAMGEKVGLSADMKGTLVIDAESSIYMRLDQFTMVNTDTSEVLKDTIETVQTEVTPYVGKWYSLPLNDEIKKELKGLMINPDQTDMRKEGMEMITKFFEKNADFLIVKKDSTIYKGIDADHFTLTIDGASLVKHIPEMAAKFSPRPLNKYGIRKDIKRAGPFIEKFFANFSSELWAAKSNKMLLATSMKLMPTSFIFPAELTGGTAGSMMLEMFGGDEYNYPASVTIEIPTGAEDLSEYVSDINMSDL
ncbi:MAG: S-layer homology domain-containing protein [Candidatus Gracilibacteria bacterium]